MNMNDQTEAWDQLYASQKRPWKGVSNMAHPFRSGDSVLDVGCGNGKTSAALLEMGCCVTGIDISQEAVNNCSEMFPDMRSMCASVVSLPFGDLEFDGVAMVHVTEHLTDDEMKKAKEETERVLKVGGIMFIRSFTAEDMRARSGGMVIKGNGIRYIYRSDEDIIKAFSGFETISSRVIREETKFGETRSRIEIIVRKTMR